MSSSNRKLVSLPSSTPSTPSTSTPYRLLAVRLGGKWILYDEKIQKTVTQYQMSDLPFPVLVNVNGINREVEIDLKNMHQIGYGKNNRDLKWIDSNSLFDCPICFNTYISSEKFTCAICNNSFCKECVKKLPDLPNLTDAFSCPMCRRSCNRRRKPTPNFSSKT